MNNQGFVKIHRSLLNWEWYSDLNTRVLFLHILLKANHKPQKWQGITIEKGQFVTSIGHLAQESGLSVRNVRTSLEHLKSTNELTSQTTSRYSIITINNWDKWQRTDKVTDKRLTSDRQTTDKRPTTNKNDKNEKNDKNIIFIEEKSKKQNPTLEEIKTYCNSIGRKIDYQAFYDFYSSYEWKDTSGMPIRWKQKVVTWSLKSTNQTKVDDEKERKQLEVLKQIEEDAKRRMGING